MTLPVHNVWVAVDLDGTILEGGHYPALGAPMPGAKAGLEELNRMGFKIMIWTARTAVMDTHGQFQNVVRVIDEIRDHMMKHGLPYQYILTGMTKPTLVYRFIDDRAIEFKGSWPDTLGNIKQDLRHKGVPIFGDKRPFMDRLVL